MATDEDDPFAQLSNSGSDSEPEASAKTGNDQKSKPEDADPFASLSESTEGDPFAQLANDSPQVNTHEASANQNAMDDDPFANLAGTLTSEEKEPLESVDNHELHDDNLSFFATSNDHEVGHEDDHSDAEEQQLLENSTFDVESDHSNDPFWQLGNEANTSTSSEDPNNPFFQGIENTSNNPQENASSWFNPNEGTSTYNQSSTNQQGNSTLNGGNNYANQGNYAQNNANNYQNNQALAQQAALDTQNKYQNFNDNLQASQQFMNQFQQNVGTLSGNQSGNANNAGYYPPPQAQNYLNSSVSYMEELGQRLYFKQDRNKVEGGMKAEVEQKLSFLIAKINKDVRSYRSWEKTSKRWAFIFKFLSSALAAIVTVLLGINITDTLRAYAIDWWINFFALVISAFISLIGVFQQFYDSDKLWIKYTDTANKLEQLLSTIEYVKLSGDFVDLNDVNAVKMEYDRIIESTHNYEIEIRAENDDTSDRIRKQGTVNR